MAVLKLFEAKSGPVLEDFPEDVPASEEKNALLACPVNFGPTLEEQTDHEKLCSDLKKEMASLRPWYDLALQKRGRTTVGLSGLDPEAVGEFICAFLKGETPENPRNDISLPYTLNLATDDLKAYYFEAVTSQPGQESPPSQTLSDWFYDQTMAGRILFALRDSCKQSPDGLMKILGNVLIIPAAEISKRKNKTSLT